MALLDNGVQINTIVLGFIENHSLDIGLLSDLIGRWATCVGLGNVLTQLMGYIVIWVQVDRVQGYDEDHIALVIPDLSCFKAWVPVILGTPMISHIMNVIKEREIDALVTQVGKCWVAYLLAVWWATATLEDDKVVIGVSDPVEYDEVVTTKEPEIIDVQHLVCHCLYQALCPEDGSLPHAWQYRMLALRYVMTARMSPS